MRAAVCLLAVAVVAGCTSAPEAPVRTTAARTPTPTPAATLPPLPAGSAGCELPGEKADDLRAADARTAWRSVWVDEERGSMSLLAAAPDGALWSTYWSEKQEDGALVGRDGGVRRWDGSRWETFQIPQARPGRPQTSVAVAAASADQAWVFGVSNGKSPKETAGVVAAFADGVWRAEPLPEPAARSVGWAFTTARAVDGAAWAVNGPAAVSWTGGHWRQHPLPAAAGALSSGDGELWAVSGQNGEPAALRWESGAWRRITTPPFEPPADVTLPRATLSDVVVLGPDDVWVVGGLSWTVLDEYDEENEPAEKGHSLAMHWDGNGWTCDWGPLTSTVGRMTRFGQAEPDGRGGLWVIGRRDVLWHLDGRRWTRHRVPAPPGAEPRVHSLAWRPGSREVYAVGSVVTKGADNSEISHAALWRS
ncbi:hypothetical protein GT755_10515 [Herbidospora sp. NEAU-GS84]|uniref:Uncharacterized protein n=1 Tax=Herbidospora solisilvae TaxID=2696284 RepID=A0A7C9NDQ8_9ACTN|nr:hypothetical protein [Herbidospora solisilvae]NAS22115.1 hypothetical protein [Herbidospora solisilvae]